ncbi:MAG: NADH oxidase [Crocinitomicaceae bacterium]|nr:NADH oxidase [Crocinitomicaceae bacterium]|tara:strand:- start:7784 stop:8101 length:318 start_codon:yes stop_codon:yes gene_type:complete
MKAVSVTELKEKLDNKENIKVLDVREDHEREIAKFTDFHIPMGEVLEHLDEIPKDVPVIVHCRSGQRSATVIDLLEREHGYDNLYNLNGGILSWANEIDKSLNIY